MLIRLVLCSILLLALSWQLKLGLFVFAAYTVLGLASINRLLNALWTHQLSADRFGTESICELGKKGQVTVTLRNNGFYSIPWLLLEDSLPHADMSAQPPALSINGPSIALVKLRPSESKTIQYEIEFRRRGYFQFGPLLAETGDLFGLHRTYRILTDPHFVMVLPKVLPLQTYDIASSRPVGEIKLAHRLFEDPTRISGVRVFQHGDPINRIHWRATARTGTLQSKTFESTCVAGATIVVDMHRASYLPNARFYAPELAITLAATFTNAVFQMGQQVGLVSNGRDAAERMKFQGWDLTFKTREFARRGLLAQEDNRRLAPVVVETRRDAKQFQIILETLARLELTDEYVFHEMLAEAGPRLPHSATVIAIISLVTPEIASVLGNLKRRGYSVFALRVTYGELEHPDWAAPPEWAGLLLQEGIPFRTIGDESAIITFCSECLI
jgi:uncharacterized protein (DUF58 family)